MTEKPVMTTTADNPIAVSIFPSAQGTSKIGAHQRLVHAKDWGAYGTFTVTIGISKYSRAKLFSEVGKRMGIRR